MKTRTSVKKICRKCRVVRRKRCVFILCFTKKHNQRQGC